MRSYSVQDFRLKVLKQTLIPTLKLFDCDIFSMHDGLRDSFIKFSFREGGEIWS
jgi:hypothetical protein